MQYLSGVILYLAVVSISLAQVFVELSNESYAQYEASDVNISWQGRAPIDSLELLLDQSNLENSSLRMVIKATEFRSGNIFRDADARRVVFEVSDYPDIIFESTRVAAQGVLQNGLQEIQLTGNLTMHGVTKSLTLKVGLKFDDSLLTATGNFQVLLLDFGMRRPTLLGITVNDEVNVTFDIQGSLQDD